MLLELRKRHYPAPLSNDRRGTPEGIQATTHADIQAHFRKHFHARGSIISVAGNVEWKPLVDQIGRLFGDWSAGEHREPACGPSRALVDHIPKETTQTQIGIAYPSVPFGHADYYAAMGAVNVLSRRHEFAALHRGARESAACATPFGRVIRRSRTEASILCYAGTTTSAPRRRSTLRCAELQRLADGIEEDEVERVQARSEVVAHHAGRVDFVTSRHRSHPTGTTWAGCASFDEIQAGIDSLTPTAILDHVRRHPPRDLTIVTLGQKALQLNHE